MCPPRAFSAPRWRPGNPGRGTSPSFGLPGTQVANLEVSALPPINLDGRLEYLIRYPYGCLEQTTSSVFPQLYLPALIKLDQNRRLEVENNIRAGLARLRSLQHPNGGFAYWPGLWNTDGSRDWRNNWGTTYAGHFFLEAEKAGYSLPGDMKSSWLRYQKDAAQQWNARQHEPGRYALDLSHAERYAQAYRLYTLALAGAPEIGAMNRMREVDSLSLAERWLLASTYKLAGKPDVAKALVDKDHVRGLRVRRCQSLHLWLAVARSRSRAHGDDAARPRRRDRAAARGRGRAALGRQLVQHAIGGFRAGGRGAEHRRETLHGLQLRLRGGRRAQADRQGRCAGRQHQTTTAAGDWRPADAHQHLGAQAVRHGCGARDPAQR